MSRSNFGAELRGKQDRLMADKPAEPATTPAAAPAPARPVTPMGQVAMMQPTIDKLNEQKKAAEVRAAGAEARAAELEQQLEKQPTEAAVDQLIEVAGRRRKLTQEEFAELVENLRNNPLVHPVVVKRLRDGRFEIISGHNRVHAYRVLGRERIAIVVADIEDDGVDRIAFYANLLQPALPDFLKFQGFQRERDRHQPKLTQAELARAAGVDKRIVSRLFVFEELPERAQELIAEQPHVIGAACAADLARLASEGATDRVVEAVEQLVVGKFGQKEAVAYASRPAERPKVDRPAPTKIRSGRFDYCSVVATGKSLRIDFKDESLRADAEAAVQRVLRELAGASDAESQVATPLKSTT
jgi:ParB family chromosome partitioning protein